MLDTGCGPGVRIAKFLGERFRVTGVDISEKQLALTSEVIPGARFIHGDLIQLPFSVAQGSGANSLPWRTKRRGQAPRQLPCRFHPWYCGLMRPQRGVRERHLSE